MCGCQGTLTDVGAQKKETFAYSSRGEVYFGERLFSIIWWAHEDSNLGQSGYEPEALPTEL